ncbi:uncharacterized protein LOC134671914 [Cydia fagiglandana]|uniref:uncharacterized protein LOC134671914 n=1 Tax=Cydia fagiglandana TaxID=1458189 RepID=UPI002FEE09E5
MADAEEWSDDGTDQGGGSVRHGLDYDGLSRGEGLRHQGGRGLGHELNVQDIRSASGSRMENPAQMDKDFRRSRSLQRRWCGSNKEDGHKESQAGRKRWRLRDYSSSSSGSDGDSPLPKRRRRGTSKQSETSTILDKFLSILDKVRDPNKHKLPYNTNVVPEFDPMSKEQTVLAWLTKVEECAEIYGWDDKATIHYALPKLSGVAKTWYQGLPTLLFTWPEWKKKLIESFPCREDYAELLTEMLEKKVKYGESLEHYYYAKINLLNRCKITGKEAVDCIVYGIEDRAIKVGAQAAQFKEPSQVLKYFRTVKVANVRNNNELSQKKISDRNNSSTFNRPGSSRLSNVNSSITCFNCKEMGHPSFKCNKPVVKCTLCDRLGHSATHH